MSRLIDADELKKEIADLVVGGEERIIESGTGNDWIHGIHSACREIDNAPTVGQIDGDMISRKYIKLFACEYEKFVDNNVKVVKAVPIEAIDNAPTVEARPKGKWIHYEQVNGLGGFWKCSCCGEPAIFTPRLAINNSQIYGWDNSKTNFCPYCGADMGGDV